jgi:hypothetical protein
MSLRAFHIIFVIVTIALSLWVALWGIREFSEERNFGALALGLLFAATAVALMIYGKKTYVKLRDLPVLALLLVVAMSANDALACTVCYGAPGDPLVKGANNGIMLLLGIVGFVQIGFIALFWSFWRRARDHKRFRESLRVIEGGSRS